MKTVYHGTTIDRAKLILTEKCIHTTSKENRRYPNTKCNFVYVTERLCDAMDFSTRPGIGIDEKNRRTFFIFKIIIDENELIHDEDEEKWRSTLSDGGAKHCFKSRRDLVIGQDVVAYFRKECKDDLAAGNYMQDIQYGTKTIKEEEWKKLCHA